MLVTLAVLLLMMTAIVKIFQAATGALNSAQVYQELDNQLRLLDLTIRSDLGGVTCKLTPPNDPKNNLGYFEYGENEFADVQGEDSDDYIRFTAKAPPGQQFTGRMWVRSAGAKSLATNQLPQPITITSEYAEIIYFLRNGNLYRRVLLVAPERQAAVEPSVNNVNPSPPYNGAGFFPLSLGGNPVNLSGNQVSWQAVNDLSAHPATRGLPFNHNSVILNTLGDLTNRENRFAHQRFSDDFQNLAGVLVPGGDGLADDVNGDNVPDYYPTLYPGVLPPALGGTGPPVQTGGQTSQAIQLIYEPINAHRHALGLMAFPFIFPDAYANPQWLSTGVAPYGWINSPNPQVYIVATNSSVAFDTNPLLYLNTLNHNPIDVGDNLPVPPGGNTLLGKVPMDQTWWGFPTWRETLSPFWQDPTAQINMLQGQPTGLIGGRPLPGMAAPYHTINPQPFNDGTGTTGNGSDLFPLNSTEFSSLWSQFSWEDDLIMTGVRSFDVKAYDSSLSAYADLGWGDDLRYYPLNIAQNPNPQTILPFLNGTPNPSLLANPGFNTPIPFIFPSLWWNNLGWDLINQTFAHEGRIPPLVADNRYDAQFGPAVSYLPSNSPYLPPNGTYTGNIGDDNPNLSRLRRVWDSWSTEYTKAPGTGVNPAGTPAAFFPAGPPNAPPIYPSYPPPYPQPLRGIQIQIRVTDPTNQRIKTLTIRQDFTDKL
jgi:hypothetical protein